MVKVGVVDDNEHIRTGLRLLLSFETVYNLVGEWTDGSEIIDALELGLEVDILVMDVSMPNIDGITATKTIKESWPDIKILIITMHDQDQYIKAIKASKANGYLQKEDAPTHLVSAINSIIGGDNYFKIS